MVSQLVNVSNQWGVFRFFFCDIVIERFRGRVAPLFGFRSLSEEPLASLLLCRENDMTVAYSAA